MKLRMYQVDAFADKVFSGNPAAVCPLDGWPGDELLQQIATENNLAETAFYVRDDNQYEIRWFTPTLEVDLCGHATLAAAYVLFNLESYGDNTINFLSRRSGMLTVTRQGDDLTLDFPVDIFQKIELSADLENCFDISPIESLKGKTDYVLVYESEQQIKDLRPNLLQIATLPGRGVIATAKGDEADFVSRFFAPQSGVNEDPVTGSAHTTLTPYWEEKLGKVELSAVQLSARKGYLRCKRSGDRVLITGRAKLYFVGEIYTE